VVRDPGPALRPDEIEQIAERDVHVRRVQARIPSMQVRAQGPPASWWRWARSWFS
jgi:hypothetical protein